MLRKSVDMRRQACILASGKQEAFMTVDFAIAHTGRIVLIPKSVEAWDWIEDNDIPYSHWLGGCIEIDARSYELLLETNLRLKFMTPDEDEKEAA